MAGTATATLATAVLVPGPGLLAASATPQRRSSAPTRLDLALVRCMHQTWITSATKEDGKGLQSQVQGSSMNSKQQHKQQYLYNTDNER